MYSINALSDDSPDDSLGYIFSFLPIKSLLHCSETCRRWKQIASHNLLWVETANRLSIRAKEESLRVTIGKVMQEAKILFREIKEQNFWKNSETPAWMFLVYDRLLLRNHSLQIRAVYLEKKERKEAHAKKLKTAFTNVLLLYRAGIKKNLNFAFDLACVLRRNYSCKEPLYQLEKVYWDLNDFDGLIQVAQTLGTPHEMASLFLKIVKAVKTTDKERAKLVAGMIPFGTTEREQGQMACQDA